MGRLAVMLGMACLSCGTRTGLLGDLAAEPSDASQPVATFDASVGDAADAAHAADAASEAGLDAGKEAGADANAACAISFDTISECNEQDLSCCQFSIRWTCGGRSYGAGAACPMGADGGPVTYQGTCYVDGHPTTGFTMTLPACTCDVHALASAAGAQCRIGG